LEQSQKRLTQGTEPEKTETLGAEPEKGETLEAEEARAVDIAGGENCGIQAARGASMPREQGLKKPLGKIAKLDISRLQTTCPANKDTAKA